MLQNLNKITDILPIINAAFATHYFKDIQFYGLAEIIEKKEVKTACVYSGAGEYTPILEDTKGLIVYHRLISFDNEEDTDGGFGRFPLTTETYKLLTVFFGNQNAIEKDCKDINHYLVLEFKKLLPRTLNLGVSNNVSVSGINYDKIDLADSEGIDLIPENVLFALELTVVLKFVESCNTLKCG